MASFLAWRDERRGCGHAWSRHRSCVVSTPFAALRAVSLFALFPPVKSPSASFVPVQKQGFKRFCCLLFKIRALRQESPIAVQLQFGAWSPQNGASTRMKIAVNCACLHLIALNSPLYAREAVLLRSLCGLLFKSETMCASLPRSRLFRPARTENR